ncbi:MAG: rhodanese-like domain-containing protein [Opitutaceae bacterium]
MLKLFKEFCILLTLTLIGVAYSVFSGLVPTPGTALPLEAGEILLIDAQVLNPIWIDARAESDFATDHIEGALSLNESNWDTQIPELIGKWLSAPRPIVIYCSSKSCGTSKRIAERLRSDLPDAEIYSLHGGWQP